MTVVRSLMAAPLFLALVGLPLLPGLYLGACAGSPTPPAQGATSPSSAEVAKTGGESPAMNGSAGAKGAEGIDAELTTALAGSVRTDAERARDVYRHPRETLELFGLRDNMHVVELWAPGGFYTAILAPVVRDHGHLAVTMFDPNGDPKAWQTQESKPYAERLDKSPDVFGMVERIVMKPPAYAFGPDGDADLVVTFRNVHNWMPEAEATKIFAAAFKALKPGGVFGVVDHRGKPGMTDKQVDDSGYIPEEMVIGMATKVGFELAEKSEVNANPKDTKDYAKGVWALPPSFANKDVDHAKYAAIGESDRMTLKFVKP